MILDAGWQLEKLDVVLFAGNPVPAPNQGRLTYHNSLGTVQRREPKETGHTEWICHLYPAQGLV